MNPKFEIAKRELHAKLLCRRARTRWQVTMAGRGAWLRCPWAVAGPGRTTSRRAEPKARGRAAAHGHPKQPGPAGRRSPAHTAARPACPRNANGTTSNARNPAHPAARPDNAQNTSGTTSTASRRATADRHTQQPGPTMPGTPAAPQAAPEEQAAPETPAEPHATLQIKRRHRRRPASARSAGFTRPRGGQLRA